MDTVTDKERRLMAMRYAKPVSKCRGCLNPLEDYAAAVYVHGEESITQEIIAFNRGELSGGWYYYCQECANESEVTGKTVTNNTGKTVTVINDCNDLMPPDCYPFEYTREVISVTNSNVITVDKRNDERQSNCRSCGDTFTPKRSDSKYCSSKCRQKAYRQRGGK